MQLVPQIHAVPLSVSPVGQIPVHPSASQVAHVVGHGRHTPPLTKVPLRQALQVRGEGVQAVQSESAVKQETALLVAGL